MLVGWVEQGGELWSLLHEKRSSVLPRNMHGGLMCDAARPHAQFYAACVLSALAYLHGMDVAYRDLKPENLLLAASGYLKVRLGRREGCGVGVKVPQEWLLTPSVVRVPAFARSPSLP